MAQKCDSCGKPISGKPLERSGKRFHNDKCMKDYGKKHPSKKNVCEFC